MSHNDRIEAAQNAISQHNEAVGEGNPGVVNAEAFIQCVKATGGTSEDRLSALSHEDLLACLPEIVAGAVSVKPRILAKEIAGIFRTKRDDLSQLDNTLSRPVSAKKAERMTPRELVESFDPEDSNNSVGKRLMEIGVCQGQIQKFIVYSSARIVDVENTYKILMEIKAGFPGRDDIDVNGCVKKVYRLGELPENYTDENPLYRNRPLRPDGTCDQLGRSWEGVELSIRQFIRVAMDVGELTIGREIAHNLLDAALEPDTLKILQKRYRKAAIKYDELNKTGNLPTLKIALGYNPTGILNGGKKVVFSDVSYHNGPTN